MERFVRIREAPFDDDPPADLGAVTEALFRLEAALTPREPSSH